MIRSGRSASLTRSSLRHVPSSTLRTTSSLARTNRSKQQAPRGLSLRRSSPLALTLHKPFSTSLQRYAAPTGLGHPSDKIDKKHEKDVSHEKLEPHPEEVSVYSSTHQTFSEKGVEEPERDEDMLAGIKADLVGLSQDNDHRKRSRTPLHSMKCPEKPLSSAWQVSCPTLQHPPRRSI